MTVDAVGKAALFSNFERQLPRISLSRNSVKTSGRSWQGDAGGRVADNQTPKTDIRQLPIFGKDIDETYMSEMLLEDSIQGHDSTWFLHRYLEAMVAESVTSAVSAYPRL